MSPYKVMVDDNFRYAEAIAEEALETCRRP